METAAATAPEAPAISTVLASVEVAAPPKIRPKMETVPSSMPKTTVPAEWPNELRSRCKIEPSVMLGLRLLSRATRCPFDASCCAEPVEGAIYPCRPHCYDL